MAKPRARKPRANPKSDQPPEELFVGIPGNPLERASAPVQEEAEGTLADAVNDLLGVPPESRKDEPKERTVSFMPASSVDEYVRNQVMREMYGKENPTDYDLISLAIKRRL